MKKIKNRKEYIEKIYSKYWIEDRDPNTGIFQNYENNLCNLIEARTPPKETMLEVGIGKGETFAGFFDQLGYSVYGIDISPELVEACKKLHGNVNCRVGDAENLDYPDNFFYVTYCFKASWYFPNLFKAIDEMIRVTKPGGFVIFDVMNRNNPEIEHDYQRCLFRATPIGKTITLFKNIMKIVLHKGYPEWHFMVYYNPAYPESIYQHLRNKQICRFQVMVKKENDTLELAENANSLENFGKLIFLVEKK